MITAEAARHIVKHCKEKVLKSQLQTVEYVSEQGKRTRDFFPKDLNKEDVKYIIEKLRKQGFKVKRRWPFPFYTISW